MYRVGKGVPPNQIGVSGTTVSYGGMAFGTVSGGTNDLPLIVRFNSQATAARSAALLRNICYQNIGANPVKEPRRLRVVVTDGDGAMPNAVEKTVHVICPAQLDVMVVRDVSSSLSGQPFVDEKGGLRNSWPTWI